MYRWASRRGHIFSLGLRTTVFQAEIHAIKTCIMENIEKGYIGRNSCILSDSQAAIKALDSYQINSKLVWDCHQSLVKLAEHDRIQLIWVPGHMRIDGNEVADQLARQGSSHPFIGPDPALGISAKVARGVIRAGRVGNTRSIGSSYVDKDRLRTFLKKKLGNSLIWVEIS
jgi:ribonuclease HI